MATPDWLQGGRGIKPRITRIAEKRQKAKEMLQGGRGIKPRITRAPVYKQYQTNSLLQGGRGIKPRITTRAGFRQGHHIHASMRPRH